MTKSTTTLNSNQFPILITLSESIDSKITSNQVFAGFHVRKIIDTTNNASSSSVASFAKDIVQDKPDWLNMICHKHYNGSSPDFTAFVSFGDGNDLCVKIRKQKKNHDGSCSGSSATGTSASMSTLQVSFRLGVYLDDGTVPGRPADMLDPRDDFNVIMQASRQEANTNQRGPLHLFICPSKPTISKRSRSDFEHHSANNNQVNSTIVILIDNDNQVIQIFDNEQDASLIAATRIGGAKISALEEAGSPSDHHDESDNKTKKRKQDSPKKPQAKQTAYTYFMTDYRSQVLERNPSASFSDIAKIIGEKWRTLGKDERAKYDAMASKDRVRYEDAMAIYESKVGPGGAAIANHSKKKRSKKKKDPNEPVAPRNRYVLFCGVMRSKIRKANPDYSGERINSELNIMYSELSDTEKEKYDKMSEDDKERYTREMEEYKKSKQGLAQQKDGEAKGENDDEETEDEEEEPESSITFEELKQSNLQNRNKEVEEGATKKVTSSRRRSSVRGRSTLRQNSDTAASKKQKRGKKEKSN